MLQISELHVFVLHPIHHYIAVEVLGGQFAQNTPNRRARGKDDLKRIRPGRHGIAQTLLDQLGCNRLVR